MIIIQLMIMIIIMIIVMIMMLFIGQQERAAADLLHLRQQAAQERHVAELGVRLDAYARQARWQGLQQLACLQLACLQLAGASEAGPGALKVTFALWRLLARHTGRGSGAAAELLRRRARAAADLADLRVLIAAWRQETSAGRFGRLARPDPWAESAAATQPAPISRSWSATSMSSYSVFSLDSRQNSTASAMALAQSAALSGAPALAALAALAPAAADAAEAPYYDCYYDKYHYHYYYHYVKCYYHYYYYHDN